MHSDEQRNAERSSDSAVVLASVDVVGTAGAPRPVMPGVRRRCMILRPAKSFGLPIVMMGLNVFRFECSHGFGRRDGPPRRESPRRESLPPSVDDAPPFP